VAYIFFVKKWYQSKKKEERKIFEKEKYKWKIQDEQDTLKFRTKTYN
jgi:hypothetical protein